MSLWGKGNGGNSSKPKWLTPEQEKNCFADERGWVLRHPSGVEEILVAGGENFAETLGTASIVAINFLSPLDGGSLNEWTTGTIEVVFDEAVDVSGTAPTADLTLPMSADGTGPFNAKYTSGSGTNILLFTYRPTFYTTDQTLTVIGTSLAKEEMLKLMILQVHNQFLMFLIQEHWQPRQGQ